MKTHSFIAAAAALAAGAAAAQEIGPSPYGAEDQIGAANLITPERVTAAADLVTEGQVYPLGIVIDRETPGFGSREFDVTILMPGQVAGQSMGENQMSYVDDMVTGWLGLGTQIDSLAHLGRDNVFYNQNRAEDFVDVTGVTKLGIEGIPPIVGRGVLLDVAAAKGAEQLQEGDVVTVEDLQAAAEAAGVTLREGDVAILHTGWLDMLEEDPARFAAGEPGIVAEGARWLADQGVVAVGADTWGLDAVPHPEGQAFPAHQVLLAESGVYILENIDTRQLVADDVSEFMFVLGQPRYRGAVQAIINPIAIR